MKGTGTQEAQEAQEIRFKPILVLLVPLVFLSLSFFGPFVANFPV
jgi:hypothetical protein